MGKCRTWLDRLKKRNRCNKQEAYKENEIKGITRFGNACRGIKSLIKREKSRQKKGMKKSKVK